MELFKLINKSNKHLYHPYLIKLLQVVIFVQKQIVNKIKKYMLEILNYNIKLLIKILIILLLVPYLKP